MSCQSLDCELDIVYMVKRHADRDEIEPAQFFGA